MTEIPKTHPRYLSLTMRERLVEGVKLGVTAMQGLIAHGRGEAFDYILGEKTRDFAIKAERAAVAMMLLARHPVISVNGNVAVLVPEDIARLSKAVGARVEVNVFHYTPERVERIKKYLEQFDVEVLAACDAVLEGLESARRIVDSRGILIADVVLVPLEDGDRCEILKKHGKKVIAIDLNPLSRTSRMADVTIVDNIVRAIPRMVEMADEMKNWGMKRLEEIVAEYDNSEVLAEAVREIKRYLEKVADEL
ncbi:MULTISPECIES: 4-phosphopantoate--beta-alanine ligase [unclassified Archaeoglobus]|jgi:4-phosphopantoate--beta-alanine ligase|uniref:4-phosphopantoate--beta-alanine ligase n=1 Tax=unclassified Archaeoglobus TaxID=2643606 RepID=UPI0025B9E07E|nr:MULTISPECIES: 4-phosphopantoate--beta-alanine ligase [unclassified Archaeoglobus]